MIFRMLMISGLLMLSFGMTAAASENEDTDGIDAFREAFGLSRSELRFGSDETDIYEYVDFINYEDGLEEDTNDFGSFSFSGGLNKERFSTFSDSKSLIGYGQEDSLVGLLVYTIEDGDSYVVDQSLRTLGASGIYSDEIYFADNCMQYLVVAVKDDAGVHHRVFEVTTKEEATRTLLENIEIKFIIDEEVPVVPVFEVLEMPELDF